MNKSILMIIPARGGSKGIPKKNSKKIGKYTMIEYPIISAIKSKIINQVYVTTDCESVISLCKKYKEVTVIKRPGYLCEDSSSSESAIIHALDKFKNKNNFLPDITIFRQCTSPFIFSCEIKEAIHQFLDEKLDVIFSVKKFEGFLWDKNSKPVNHSIDSRQTRQNADFKYLQEDGAFYIFNTTKFLKNNYRFFGKIGYYLQPNYKSIDIDNSNDLKMAKIMAQNNKIIDEFN